MQTTCHGLLALSPSRSGTDREGVAGLKPVSGLTCYSFLLCVISPSKYYEKEALLMDPVDGPILASLLGKPFLLAYLDSVCSSPLFLAL